MLSRSTAAATAADAAVLAADEAQTTSRAILELLKGAGNPKDQVACRTDLSLRTASEQPRGPGSGKTLRPALTTYNDASRDDQAVGDVAGHQIEVRGLSSPLHSALIRPSPPGMRSSFPMVNSDNVRG